MQIVHSAPGKDQIVSEIKQVFGPNSTTAVAVAMAESGLDPLVINKVGCCVGVFQIHRYAHASQIPGATMAEKTAWLQNPDNNIRFAKQLFDASSWYPWETWTKGLYRKYMP